MNERSNKQGLIYLSFRLLLSKDIWCACFGIIVAIILTPKVCQTRENMEIVEKIVAWIMIMALGWAVAILPADKISGKLQSLIKDLYKNNRS